MLPKIAQQHINLFQPRHKISHGNGERQTLCDLLRIGITGGASAICPPHTKTRLTERERVEQKAAAERRPLMNCRVWSLLIQIIELSSTQPYQGLVNN